METHSGGYPAPTMIPIEQQVRTCRAATDTRSGKGKDKEPGQDEAIVRGED